jgi:hypothetical protein
MSGSRRAKVKVVTGIVTLPDHTRKRAEYDKLFEKLLGALGDNVPMLVEQTVQQLWMTPFIEGLSGRGHTVSHSQGDNPLKNSMEYHAIQHQKFEWLEMAARHNEDADSFLWLDYGIMRLPGFNSEYLTDFLRRVKKNDLAVPGCWEKKEVVDHYPCWRFCGSMFLIPRQDVFPLNQAFKAITRLYVRSMRNVTWEVNDLARMELAHVGPHIRWYPADHNATMLTGY